MKMDRMLDMRVIRISPNLVIRDSAYREARRTARDTNFNHLIRWQSVDGACRK